MKFDGCTWLRLLVPMLISAAVTGLCAWWWAGAAAAVCVSVGCVLTLFGTAWAINGQAEAAAARLRSLQLRGRSLAETGIYAGLLRQTMGLLEQSDTKAQAATQGRTELEARFCVRQKQTRRLESAVQCVPEPLLITDGSDKLVFWNAAAADLFRALPPAQTDIASPAGADLDVNRLPELRGLIAETRSRSAATSSRSVEFEIELAGTPRAFRAAATHLRDEDGSSLGVAAFLRDIGREKCEKSRHAEFVSSVAHELKTPMASIKAFIELLMDGDVEDQDERLRLYGFIDVQVDRLTRLVNNMLNLARIESGVIKVQREDCGLKDVLEKALQVVQPMADEKQIKLIPQFSELYVPVHVDRDLFGQAVINLLSNAVKYTPEGGEVRLRSRMTDTEAVIDVQDNGMGIPEADLSRLFQRFFRVERNNKAAAGTGLGLALVQYIVNSIHNGKLTVQSQVNEGSCFSVAIPLGHRDQNRRKAEPHACAV